MKPSVNKTGVFSQLSKFFLLLLMAALFTIVSAGCSSPAIFLKPVYTKDVVIYHKSLEGTWLDEDEILLIISPGPGKSYYFEYGPDEDGLLLKLRSHFFELEGQLFMDVTLDDKDLRYDRYPATLLGHLVPTHFVGLSTIENNSWTFELLIAQWIDDYLQENPGELEYNNFYHLPLIISDARDVQDFLVKHGRDWETNDVVFSRKPQDMEKSTKLKDVSYTIESVNTYSPLKEPWGEYKVIVETSTLPHEALLREIALEIWRTEGAGFHEFNIEYYLPEMDTAGIPYAESVVGPDGVSSFDFSQ